MTLTVEERTRKAKEKAARLERQQRIDARNEREAKKRKDKRRHYILGEFIAEHFPEVLKFEPGTKAENAVEFAPFIETLLVLSADQELMDWLKYEVRRRLLLKKHQHGSD